MVYKSICIKHLLVAVFLPVSLLLGSGVANSYKLPAQYWPSGFSKQEYSGSYRLSVKVPHPYLHSKTHKLVPKLDGWCQLYPDSKGPIAKTADIYCKGYPKHRGGWNVGQGGVICSRENNDVRTWRGMAKIGNLKILINLRGRKVTVYDKKAGHRVILQRKPSMSEL